MSHNLNSSKGGYIRDCIGDCCRGYKKGCTRSLDSSSYDKDAYKSVIVIGSYFGGGLGLPRPTGTKAPDLRTQKIEMGAPLIPLEFITPYERPSIRGLPRDS